MKTVDKFENLFWNLRKDVNFLECVEICVDNRKQKKIESDLARGERRQPAMYMRGSTIASSPTIVAPVKMKRK